MTSKNLILAAALSVTALGGAAYAADVMHKGPMRADTNGDGVVSRAEFFTASEARFKKHDTNGDRQLSGDEMKDRGGRFAREDTNNDGKLSFAEAAATTTARFGRMDANADGKLTPEEMGPKGPHGQGGPDGQGPGMDGERGPMGGMMMQRIDTNHDGKISRDEMRAQADQRFDRMDTNHDGSIDQAELQAMRPAMGEGRGPGMRGHRYGQRGMDDMPPPPPPADNGQ